MPKVSVIIPAYNCQAYVAQAIQSVLNQSHRDFEIIVIDDGSSDNTLQALAPYADRIQLIRQHNSGVAVARNAGLRAAKGDLLAFLDADDWWEPERISTQLAALQLFPSAGLVFSDFAVVEQNGALRMPRGIRWKYGSMGEEKDSAWEKIFSDADTITSPGAINALAYHGHILRRLFQGNFINTCSVLLKRAVLEQIGEFDPNLKTEEDYEYWLRVTHQWSAIYVDYPLVTFRLSPGQLTRTDNAERVAKNIFTVIQRTSAAMSAHLDPRQVAVRFRQMYLRLGVIALRAGRGSEARFYLKKNLRGRPISGLAWILYLFSFLPSAVFTGLLRIRARLK